MDERQCPSCDAWVRDSHTECPHCQEPLPETSPMETFRALQASSEVRRGLLYMLWSVVIYYFAAGYGFPFEFPGLVEPILVHWVLPLWFLSGLGMVIYGVYRHFGQ